jgi:hypothetical protein
MRTSEVTSAALYVSLILLALCVVWSIAQG